MVEKYELLHPCLLSMPPSLSERSSAVSRLGESTVPKYELKTYHLPIPRRKKPKSQKFHPHPEGWLNTDVGRQHPFSLP